MSSCNDLVTSETVGTTIMSGHFDKRIRFWDTRTEKPHTEIEVQGRVTSLDLSRGKRIICTHKYIYVLVYYRGVSYILIMCYILYYAIYLKKKYAHVTISGKRSCSVPGKCVRSYKGWTVITTVNVSEEIIY